MNIIAQYDGVARQVVEAHGIVMDSLSIMAVLQRRIALVFQCETLRFRLLLVYSFAVSSGSSYAFFISGWEKSSLGVVGY